MTDRKFSRYLRNFSTPQQIRTHPTNTSTSKNLNPFSRAPRFQSIANPSFCQQFFYSTSDKAYRSQRAASFGHGHKTDFTKAFENTPAPGTYEQKNFSIEERKDRGCSFGVSRSQANFLVFNPKIDTPGPGAYDIKNPPARNVSLPRQNSLGKNDSLVQVGPGSYEFSKLFECGHPTPISSFRSSRAFRISRTVRTKVEADKLAPGFNEIQNENLDNQGKVGQFFNSRFKSTMPVSFTHSTKFSEQVLRTEVPGPGTYVLPSEFGIYKSSTLETEADSASFR